MTTYTCFMTTSHCHKLNHTLVHSQQKTQHVVISQGERSHCYENLEFHWCSSDQNKSNILSKYWKDAKVRDTIGKLFDYRGGITLLKPD